MHFDNCFVNRHLKVKVKVKVPYNASLCHFALLSFLCFIPWYRNQTDIKSSFQVVGQCIMIEQFFNLVLALASVAITLLDPVMQVANGMDLLWEADHVSPLIVYCPPMVAKGSWMCSERQPLPECSLSCPSGLVPASKDRVDCENKTHLACVPAAAAILGGLDSDDQPVDYTEVFTFRDGFLQQLNQNTPNTSYQEQTQNLVCG